MFFARQKQTKPQVQTKGGNELQLAFLPKDHQIKPPQRKINRLATIKVDPALTDDTQLPNGENSDSNSDQQQAATSGITTNRSISTDQRTTGSSSSVFRYGKHIEEAAPRFGPCYGSDRATMADTKKKSLEHVLKKTSNEVSEAKEIYSSAIRKVEEKARDVYANTIDCSASEFRQMMIQDGCFFLQLALWILKNDGTYLQYPSNHPLFGKKPNKMASKLWIEAMFFVGNQIPLVILKELMDQKFFKDAVSVGKWDQPPQTSFCKVVLYDLLISPSRNTIELPSDVLHGLYDMVIGPGSAEKKKKKKSSIHDDFDLEANEDFGDGKRMNQISVDDNRRLFPSAMDLDVSGICIAKLKKGGVRGINFKSYYFWATLYLPALPIDDDIQIVFGNLKTYETSQQLEKHKREVGSYLRLMGDLVRTSKDVKLLRRRGIIQDSTGDEDELPEMLSNLGSDVTTLTYDFHVLRRKIRDYSGPPWARIKSILNVVAFLTLVQTVFTVLAYFRPPKTSP